MARADPSARSGDARDRPPPPSGRGAVARRLRRPDHARHRSGPEAAHEQPRRAANAHAQRDHPRGHPTSRNGVSFAASPTRQTGAPHSPSSPGPGSRRCGAPRSSTMRQCASSTSAGSHSTNWTGSLGSSRRRCRASSAPPPGRRRPSAQSRKTAEAIPSRCRCDGRDAATSDRGQAPVAVVARCRSDNSPFSCFRGTRRRIHGVREARGLM